MSQRKEWFIPLFFIFWLLLTRSFVFGMLLIVLFYINKALLALPQELMLQRANRRLRSFHCRQWEDTFAWFRVERGKCVRPLARPPQERPSRVCIEMIENRYSETISSHGNPAFPKCPYTAVWR